MLLPPYACAILRCASTGCLLVEERPANARTAAGRLTCFGGKLEPDERAAGCEEAASGGLLRELREELGWQPAEELRRAVDLYVDGELIAWFYVAAAPPLDAQLTFEEGRRGLWAPTEELLADPRLSSWHAVVLRAWRAGETRADFATPPTE